MMKKWPCAVLQKSEDGLSCIKMHQESLAGEVKSNRPVNIHTFNHAPGQSHYQSFNFSIKDVISATLSFSIKTI